MISDALAAEKRLSGLVRHGWKIYTTVIGWHDIDSSLIGKLKK